MEEDKWKKLESLFRRVIREELSAKKTSNICILDGKWSGISEAQIWAWKEAYPAVNIENEMKSALAWCLSNPADAPRSRFAAFLNTWFRKNQDRASIRAIPTTPSAPSWKPCAYCGKPANGSVNGYNHCRDHADDALYHVAPPDRKTRSAGS